MRAHLEPLLGQELAIHTVRTDDAVGDHNGYYAGTLRRLSETGLELRQRDGNLAYLAFKHIVRFAVMP